MEKFLRRLKSVLPIIVVAAGYFGYNFYTNHYSGNPEYMNNDEIERKLLGRWQVDCHRTYSSVSEPTAHSNCIKKRFSFSFHPDGKLFVTNIESGVVKYIVKSGKIFITDNSEGIVWSIKKLSDKEMHVTMKKDNDNRTFGFILVKGVAD